MKTYHHCARLLAAAFALLTNGQQIAGANELIPYPYNERLNKSDDVIIGKALSLKTDSASGCCENLATIKVIRVLKGTPSHIVSVFTQDEVIDLDSRCCEIGKTYLFFLSARSGKRYAIVDGHFGAILLD